MLMLVAGMLVILTAAYIYANRQSLFGTSSAPRRPPTVDLPAPEFDLPLLGGGSQKLSALRGKPVVINFWATWCPPCKEETPLLQRYSQKYAGKLVLLGIDRGEDADTVYPFVKEMGLTYPILLDETERAVADYYARDIPVTFFIDEQGILRGQHLGLLTEDLLVRYLKTIGIEP